MEENAIYKFKPIEVTTHNLHFHEESPILSTDFYDGIAATCGFDNSVRLWMPKLREMKYRDNVYKTSANSSICFEFSMEFNQFSRPINCIRFYKGDLKNTFKFILSACCDGGKVMIMSDKGCFIVRNDTSDDAYELCWCDDKLLIGFASGKIEAYEIKILENAGATKKINETSTVIESTSINESRTTNETTSINQTSAVIESRSSNETRTVIESGSSNDSRNIINSKTSNDLSIETNCNENIANSSIKTANDVGGIELQLTCTLIFNQKIHSGTIQGISFNKKYKLIATHSLDKTVKVHRIDETSLTFISVFDQKIDNSRGLFKRLFFDDDTLYIFIKNSIVHCISYPFKQVHLQKKIGPLNSTPVKILKSNFKGSNLLYICTKRSVYIFEKNNLICMVDNCSFMAITDAFVSNDMLVVSSLDGFLASVRLS